MNISSTRGFTLIELLVVIAIIGVLAGIVLASLGNARQGARTSAVQDNLVNLRTEMEIQATNSVTGTYPACTNTKVTSMIDAAKNAIGEVGATVTAVGTAQVAGDAACHVNAGSTAWAVSVPTTQNGALYWCVDSVGASKSTATVLAINAVACP